MKADDSLSLLKEWAILCDQCVHASATTPMVDEEEHDKLEKDEFVVKSLTGICYGGIGRETMSLFQGTPLHIGFISSVGTYVCCLGC